MGHMKMKIQNIMFYVLWNNVSKNHKLETFTFDALVRWPVVNTNYKVPGTENYLIETMF